MFFHARGSQARPPVGSGRYLLAGGGAMAITPAHVLVRMFLVFMLV